MICIEQAGSLKDTQGLVREASVLGLNIVNDLVGMSV